MGRKRFPSAGRLLAALPIVLVSLALSAVFLSCADGSGGLGLSSA